MEGGGEEEALGQHGTVWASQLAGVASLALG